MGDEFKMAIWHSNSIILRSRLHLHFSSFLHSINPRKPIRLQPKSMSWSCKKCTFLNSPSPKSACQLCLSPMVSSSPPASSSCSAPKWACKACTFLNPYQDSKCEVCGTRAFLSSLSSFDDLNDTAADGDIDPSVGSVFLPLQRCRKRVRDPVGDGDPDCVELSGFRGFKALSKDKEVVTVDITDSIPVVDSFKILTYNVWFREDLEVHKRMEALGDLIQLHSPDLICFQEVTPNIYDIFKRSSWWKTYRCSLSYEMAYSKPYFCMQLSKLRVKSFSCKPFSNSAMGRELCLAEVEAEGDKALVVATSHLESPCPGPPKWDQMYSKERVAQAKEAVNLLNKHPNIIFCGDMNWDDKLDGQFPLLESWVDAWTETKPGDDGWTYDTKFNKMLSGNRTLQKRLDRVFCRLRDFRISEIDMIGKEAIAGLTYVKEKKVKSEVKKLVLPVYPSDHFGLLLTIKSK